MIGRGPKTQRSRNRLPKNFQGQVPASSWTAAINATKIRITTDLPSVISGIPVGITCQGVAPTAITQISATVFDLTYAAAVIATNVMVIPANTPEIRNGAGGFLAAGTKTF